MTKTMMMTTTSKVMIIFINFLSFTFVLMALQDQISDRANYSSDLILFVPFTWLLETFRTNYSNAEGHSVPNTWVLDDIPCQLSEWITECGISSYSVPVIRMNYWILEDIPCQLSEWCWFFCATFLNAVGFFMLEVSVLLEILSHSAECCLSVCLLP